MDELDAMLKKLALKTMFRLSDEEMPEMRKEYDVFCHHVQALEAINTDGVEPLCFPYEIETTYLRPDVVTDVANVEEVLENAPETAGQEVRLPKVVG